MKKRNLAKTPIGELTMTEVTKLFGNNRTFSGLTDRQLYLALTKSPNTVKNLTLKELADQIQDILGEKAPDGDT